MILTGLHNHDNGMYGLEHREHHFNSFDTIRSLPVLLEQAGYRTARIGKFHATPKSVYHFQRILKAGGTNDPATIGRSPVEMADLCRSFMVEASDKPLFLYVASDDPHRSNAVAPNGSPIFDTPNQLNLFGNRVQGYPGVNATPYRPEDVIVP